MKKLIIILSALMLTLAVPAWAKSEKQTVVFHVEISCDGCVKKIEKNISFEKGLKDMRIDKNAQTVTLTFDPNKTNVETLKKAFEKIKKPVSKVEIVK